MIAKLTNSIRRIFCKHEFSVEEIRVRNMFGSIDMGNDIIVYMRCKKCGYHEKHKKY